MSQKYMLLNYDKNKSRNKIFLDACNNALNYDFSKVLEFAVKCRTEFYMRKITCTNISYCSFTS